MTREDALKMAKAKLECLERNTSGLWENCDNHCEECHLNYEQGNLGEQKEWLKMLIKEPAIEIKTVANAEEAEAYPINENIIKGLEEFTKNDV